MTVTVLMPVYDDWRAAALVCSALDEIFAARPNDTARVLLVDDGSAEPPDPQAFAKVLTSGGLRSLRSIDVLSLRRNLGHQRAIAVGLVYIHHRHAIDTIVVMDSDGEDEPKDVLRLLEAFERENGRQPVFAERRRRVTGLTFKAGYFLYRVVHRILTGRGVRIGNFSVIPPALVANLVVQSSLWSHYAATVVNARIPMSTVRVDRGYRLSGSSRMNFVALVAHGLSAVSVFRETVATRVLLGATAVVTAGSALLVGMVAGTLRGTPPAPWVWMSVGVLGVGVLQVVVAALVFTLATLASREQFNVLPARDCELFILEHRVLLDRP
jgi:glycosyltransferase involved in cell wall biosynthesis